MADDQIQSGGVSSATVDAFVAASEDTQRNALTKMSTPAKTALLGALKTRQAAGMLKPAATSQPASPAITSPANSLVTPGFGTYQMTGPGNKPQPVSYDQVETMRSKGYRFADQPTTEKYGRDFAADPANKGTIQPAIEENRPVLGFIPRVFSGIGGSLMEGLAGADRLLSKATGEKPIEPLQVEAAKSAAVGGVPEFLGAAGEQIAELLVGEGEVRSAVKGTELAGKAGQMATRLKELTAVLDKYPKAKALLGLGMKAAAEGSKAAAEQGGQELVRSGGDTEATGQVAKQAGLIGATIPFGAGIVKAGGKLLSESVAQRFDIDPFSVGKRLKKLDDDTALAHADNIKKIKAAQAAGDDATAARLEHDNVVLKQQTLATKQQTLSDALEKARQAVYSRLQNMKSAARAYFGQAYGEVEKSGGGKQVQLVDLSEDMSDALKHVRGSEESTKTFKDIAKKAKGLADAAELPESYDEEDWATLAPDERRALLDAEQKAKGTSPGVSLRDLNGYYSELGKVVASSSTPGDVKVAAKVMQKAIDNRIKETYGEELFKKNQLIRSQYREFAGQYLDSDSNLAKAVDAPDHYHATQTTFLSDDARQPAVRGRVKTQLIGDTKDPAMQFYPKDIAENYTRNPETGDMVGSGQGTPSWRYRRQTHQLIEHMRNLQEGLDKVGKAAGKAETATAASAEDLAKVRTAARDLSPVKKTALPTMTPEQLRQFKVATLSAAAHSLGKFGTWVAIGGLVGGAAGFLHGITHGTGVEGAVEEAGGGMVMGMIAPHMVSRLLAQPEVVNSLTRLSKSDLDKLMALPPAQRGPTEQLIKMLADEAVRTGKLQTGQIPWLRVLAGTAARKTVEAGRQAGQDQSVSLDDLENLNKELDQPTDQSQQGVQ